MALPVLVLGGLQYSGLFIIALLIGKVSLCTRNSLEKVVIFAISVQAALILVQVLSPKMSYVNQVGAEAYQEASTTNEVVRSSGTFASPYGLVTLKVSCADLRS
ncbi:hypothetical protein Kisp01_27470 [Kineosporia sp. NBRC 101677]|nr:hypothetical protein Kisp01_27470 [Kineosporia sp. NBRC 101677]